MLSAAFVCLSVCVCVVCQHDNFRTSKHRMMKLGVGALYKNLGRVRMWGHSPPGAHPQKCGVGLRRWENQCRLSSFTARRTLCLLTFVSDANVSLLLGLHVNLSLFLGFLDYFTSFCF